VFRVTQALDPNTTAVMILFEHTWARALLDAVARAQGIELMNEWIAHEAVLSIGPPPSRAEQHEAEPGSKSTDDS
jgi:hypothetical protein